MGIDTVSTRSVSRKPEFCAAGFLVSNKYLIIGKVCGLSKSLAPGLLRPAADSIPPPHRYRRRRQLKSDNNAKQRVDIASTLASIYLPTFLLIWVQGQGTTVGVFGRVRPLFGWSHVLASRMVQAQLQPALDFFGPTKTSSNYISLGSGKKCSMYLGTCLAQEPPTATLPSQGITASHPSMMRWPNILC